MTLLTTRLAERRGPHQRLARIRPPIRMGVMGIVEFQIVRQTLCKILGRIEIAALEKTPRQDAKPQLYLIQPGAMFWRKVSKLAGFEVSVIPANVQNS